MSAALDFPLPNASPWTDPKGQVWEHNGDAWVRTIIGSGIEEAPQDGNQYARRNANWELNFADEWFLGAYASPPSQDRYGQPLTEGQTYFNTSTDMMLSWDGIKWLPFGPLLNIFGLLNFTFVDGGAGYPAGSPITGPDVYGQTPAGWVEGRDIVVVRVNGLNLNEEVDNAIFPGDYTVDYSNSQVTPVNNAFATGETVIITYQSVPGDDASKYAFTIDEDDMASDSDTKLPTQQSVKAYVDNNISALPDIIGRNTIINGAFNIAQRGITFEGIGKREWTLDRWYIYTSTSSHTVHVSQEASPSNAFPYKYRLKVGTATAGIPSIFTQIEEFHQFVPGTTWTISLESDASSAIARVGSTTTLTRFSYSGSQDVTLVKDSATGKWKGTFVANTGSGALTNYQIMIYNLTGATYIADVQLERGSVMTPFDRRPIAYEQILCDRYFQKIILSSGAGASLGTGMADNGIVHFEARPLTTVMRVSPGYDFPDFGPFSVKRIDGSATSADERIANFSPSGVALQGEFGNPARMWSMSGDLTDGAAPADHTIWAGFAKAEDGPVQFTLSAEISDFID